MDHTTNLTEKTSKKLFIGFQINSHLKMHLNSSLEWSKAKELASKDEQNLTIIPYEGKEYIGFYLSKNRLTINQLMENERQLSEILQQYCPKLDCSQLKSSVLSQYFIH